MGKFYTVLDCRGKGDQHWAMAELAHKDGDIVDQRKQEKLAALWYARAKNGGWEACEAEFDRKDSDDE